MKKFLYSIVAVTLLFFTSCSDFLDRAPQDALSPSTFWQSESDAYLALTGVYSGLNNIYHDGHWTGNNCVMMDALSDNYFDYFSWEGYSVMTTGNLNSGNTGVAGSWFMFSDIRACNEYLENEANVNWSSPSTEAQYKAEAQTIRALLYLYRTQWFGDFPLLDSTLDLAGASEVTRTPVAQVRAFLVKDLEEAIPNLPERSAVAQGRICKQFAQGLLMRYYLWQNDYTNAAIYAKAIIDSGQLSLAADYNDMFKVANQYDSETIFDFSFISNTDRDMYANPFVANGALGGWSSVIPTCDLMDEFECIDGKTISESPLYDAEHPFLNRDPRLRTSIVYPGQVYTGYSDTQNGCYNSLQQQINGSNNLDWWNNAGNASKSGLQLGKYFLADNVTVESLSHLTVHFKVMRLAEAILTLAECDVEQNNLTEAKSLIDQIRNRAGMPSVDDATAASQTKMRDLVRRERRVELNGEGLRREDMVRWRVDASGNWLPGTSTDGTPYIVWKFQNDYKIEHLDGEIENRKDANGDWVAHVTGRTADGAFDRKNFQSFTEKNILWPISISTLDVNPKLTQTAGY